MWGCGGGGHQTEGKWGREVERESVDWETGEDVIKAVFIGVRLLRM